MTRYYRGELHKLRLEIEKLKERNAKLTEGVRLLLVGHPTGCVCEWCVLVEGREE